jgi:hypothetical protein
MMLRGKTSNVRLLMPLFTSQGPARKASGAAHNNNTTKLSDEVKVEQLK